MDATDVHIKTARAGCACRLGSVRARAGSGTLSVTISAATTHDVFGTPPALQYSHTPDYTWECVTTAPAHLSWPQRGYAEGLVGDQNLDFRIGSRSRVSCQAG
ncbi:hypothetical protein BaRGS_00020092 [Batillaria attramentaria]|uniref:Uncharacterized protein n=1 Tax=Batillaria attramentaria TaxID=370345 RepID=A0ABD0KN61_9CAEN